MDDGNLLVLGGGVVVVGGGDMAFRRRKKCEMNVFSQFRRPPEIGKQCELQDNIQFYLIIA